MTPPDCDTPIPAHWALALMDSLAEYMVALFHQEILPVSERANGPMKLPKVDLETLCEADRMVGTIASAYRNQMRLEGIDIIRLAERATRRSTAKLQVQEELDNLGVIDPARPLEELSHPAMIMDRSGNVLAWYLPHAMSQPNQMLLWETLALLKNPLSSSISATGVQNWRTAPEFFRMEASLKGVINLSPAWFQQGRHGGCADPEVSALLKATRARDHTREWLRQSRDILAILSGAMAIMHPDMYATGREAMVQLGRWAEETGEPEMLSVLSIWPSVYSVASIMVNRSCPIHLDSNGRAQWLDLLVSVGEYDDLDLVLPSIGLRLRYNPGTAIAMSGQLLQHGVGSVDGNRGVISFYMRDNVHEHMNVVRCNYMDLQKVPR